MHALRTTLTHLIIAGILIVPLALALPALAQGTDGGGNPPGTDGGGNPPGTDGGGNPPGNDGGGNPPSGGSGGGLQNPLNNINSLPELVDVILKAVVRIGSIVLVLALVYVGFLFVAAQGNEEKIRNARSALLWTLIGGLILLGASAISAVIGETVKNL